MKRMSKASVGEVKLGAKRMASTLRQIRAAHSASGELREEEELAFLVAELLLIMAEPRQLYNAIYAAQNKREAGQA